MAYNVLDPLHIVARTGSDDNPYLQIDESMKIINNIITLAEVPDKFSHVQVENYVEIYSGVPTSTQFIVNYQNGIVTFNPSENGETVSVTYFGKGYILYPANRIIVHNEDPNIETSLQTIIDNGMEAIEANNTLSQTLAEVDQAITDAETATAAANTAAANAVTAKNNADTATTNANTATANATAATTAANTATTNANNATTAANTATTNANNATTAANTAASFADAAAALAITATTNANNGATAATTAANNANTATTNANNAATTANNAASALTHLGAWNSATAYVARNIVSYNGSSYAAIQASTNQLPTNTSYWQLIGQKGDTGVSFTWRGNYNGATTYAVNDLVFYNGNSYVCHVNDTVGIAPTDDTKWDLVAQKGTDGTGAGTVTSVSSANADISVATPTDTPVLTLNSANSGANKILKLDTNGQTVATIILEDATHRWFTDTERTKLTGIATGANNYTHPNHSGDVTSTGDGVTVIADNAVTLAKMQDIATLSVIGRSTAATGDPEVITADTDGYVLRRSGTTLGFGAIATAGIADEAVTLAKLAHIDTSSILGRSTAGTGDVEVLTATQVRTILNVADGANNYVHPTGDGNLHVPATSTTNDGKYLKAGSTAGSLSWAAITFAELASKPTTLSGYGITNAVASDDVEVSKLKKRSMFV